MKHLIALYWQAVGIFNVEEGGTYWEALVYIATNIAAWLGHARSPALAATQVCLELGCFYCEYLKEVDGNMFLRLANTRHSWLHSVSYDVVASKVKRADGRTPQTNFMFSWPCIIVYQYSETNVMHFLFSLLRIKGLYMVRALLAHPQEALSKRHLVYCMRVTSVGCTSNGVPLQSWCNQLT
jgi:hypothetical protein